MDRIGEGAELPRGASIKRSGWFSCDGPSNEVDNSATTYDNFEAKVKKNPVLNGLLEGKISQVRMTDNSRESNIIRELLVSLGYVAQGYDNTSNLLARYLSFSGIYGNGNQLDKRMLESLSFAAKIKTQHPEETRRWKTAVLQRELAGVLGAEISPEEQAAARAILKGLDDLKLRKEIYDTANGRRLEGMGRAFNVGGINSDTEEHYIFKYVVQAYILLGIMKVGDELTTANDRFQLLSSDFAQSGAEVNRARFGVNTYDALKAALQKVAAGQDWRVE